MSVDTGVTSDLRNEIIGCKDKQQLVQLRQQLDSVQLSIDLTASTTFEQKRIKELIEGLYRIIDNKQVQLSMTRFEFVGEPIPPANPRRTAVTLVESNDEQKSSGSAIVKLNSDKYEISDDRYVLIASSVRSIISTASASPPPSIHMKNAQGSICSLASKGPIFIHNVNNSILVLSCHQARLHNIHNSIIIVNVQNNRIIIEDCDGLVVNDIEVDDFNHPTKETANPHYKIMSRDKQENILKTIGDCSVDQLPVVIRECLAKFE
ncbi:uncharacterized protein SPAPADRAFT_158132 [Spathaspora passalidarum NRRL Y-27907]|uniref:C-CAP/cofactor C-like domain-containing protein n=1 Tax=Spathaspora passalidarum (strain NRRL Y-27907 / 11-Y1) TaxID=619300 RepID=G3AVI1_SPAPN|nr:uncharacterized protein SPAPADRAFT_158132 [Spathaspora passalidarum NRRL Y-27907]EGW29930.1 hypothetical protein SPAPADRAFT_158132 [Spathaspora passalidarum NRRL Y-27907]